jgi:hypothetical protein
MLNVYKSYYLTEAGSLVKNIKENKHLLWKEGGVPCIDADNVWDKYQDKIENISIATDKGRVFVVSKETFNNNKEVLGYGFGRQYFIPLAKWSVRIQ